MLRDDGIRISDEAVLQFSIGERRFLYAAGENRILEEVDFAPTVAPAVAAPGGAPARLRFPPPAATIRPRIIEFVVTGACNLECAYCATRDRYTLPDGRNDCMTPQTAVAAIELLRPHMDGHAVTLKFFGGEPLLAPDVVKAAVEHAARLGIRTKNVIATNALLFTDDLVDFLVAHEFLLFISLDGPPDIHDANRVDHKGRGSYDRVVAKVLRLRERHPRFFETHVAINVVATPRFAGRFREQVEHLVSLGVSPKQINPNDCLPTASEQTWYSDRAWREAQREKAEIRSAIIADAARGPEAAKHSCFDIYSGLTADRQSDTATSQDGNSIVCADCQASAWSTITILPDGAVTSCIEFDRSPRVVFGDVGQGRLDLGAFMAFQQAFRTSIEEGPCARCWAVRTCQMAECYKAFARAGGVAGWQKQEDCEAIREELAPRLRDAVAWRLAQKERTT